MSVSILRAAHPTLLSPYYYAADIKAPYCSDFRESCQSHTPTYSPQTNPPFFTQFRYENLTTSWLPTVPNIIPLDRKTSSIIHSSTDTFK